VAGEVWAREERPVAPVQQWEPEQVPARHFLSALLSFSDALMYLVTS